jgi:hypothetical protein
MHFLLFLPYYFRWHYSKAISNLVLSLKEIVIFIPRFFSIPILFRTLFAPWRRLGEGYTKGFDPGAFFQTFLLNLILRIVGFVMRLLTISIALILLVLGVMLSLLVLLIWILFPVYLAFILALSIKYLF